MTEALDVANKFINALNAGDGDAVRALYAVDAKIWHNFDGALQSVEDNINTLGWMHHKLDNIHYDIQRLENIEGGFMQQHVVRGTLKSGEAFAMPAVAICMVSNGRITSLEEYLDLAHAAVLTSG